MFGVVRKGACLMNPAIRAVSLQKATIVSGPPRYRVSFAEKAALGFVMCAVSCAPGLWILAHIQDYRGIRVTKE
ncbi:hypothetical protein ACJMK2_037385 [Sinanodonta woodiana]|uniref:Uncharacterized protein n=1 Tax=Sinanodonta woodiana TaxID=1069815 RepID=A0ABD3WNQ1_SINWO